MAGVGGVYVFCSIPVLDKRCKKGSNFATHFRGYNIDMLPVVTLGLALGHAAMIIPPSRNAMDRDLPQFVGGKAPITPCTCEFATVVSCRCAFHAASAIRVCAELAPRLPCMGTPTLHMYHGTDTRALHVRTIRLT